jgi:hypothetical protein
MAIQEFRDWLVTQNTSPLIISQLCCGLNQWRETGQVTPLLEDNQLLIQQNMIGWNGVLEGCFSVSWADAQQAYYQQIQSKRTGSKWQVATCRRIWMIPWAMWEHRNSIEHASDLQKETEIVDTQIQEELNKGSGNNAKCSNRDDYLKKRGAHWHIRNLGFGELELYGNGHSGKD